MDKEQELEKYTGVRMRESQSKSSPKLDNLDGREIDFRMLFGVAWRGKFWILSSTLLLTIAGVIFSLSLPNIYRSEGIYAPAQKDGAVGGAVGQLSGLASFAGVKLGGESNDIDQAMALISSWPFLEFVVNKHELKPLIMGVKGWDAESGRIVWDDKVYDVKNKKWLLDSRAGGEAGPSSYETYLVFRDMIHAEYDLKVGMVSVTVDYYSPEIAKLWVDILVREVNNHFQLRDMRKARKSIGYLQGKIQETSIAEMQAVFYRMVEAQTKTLMLAEVDENYLLVDVVEPKIAERRSSPRRALIVLLSSFMGGLLGLLGVFVWASFDRSKVE